MIRKSRMAVALGLVLALGVATVAWADGATDNEAFVDGSVNPSKLDKKKYKPVNLFVGVRTEGPVTGTQENPEAEYISFGKNIKWQSTAAPFCTAPIETPGLTADQARAMCPGKSLIGTGEAEVNLGASRVSNVVVQVVQRPGQEPGPAAHLEPDARRRRADGRGVDRQVQRRRQVRQRAGRPRRPGRRR